MTGAVVLAAGPGTRLGILGARMAKTMMPVAGRPFLEHLAGRLLGAGLYPVVVAVNHHADTIVNHFTGHPLTPGLRFVHTDQRGTGADLLQCLNWLHTDDFIVWNGDTVADIDLPGFLDHADTAAGRAVIALTRRPDTPNHNAWFVSTDGTVLATREAKPQPAPPAEYAWRGSSTGILYLTQHLLRPFKNGKNDPGAAPGLYSGILPILTGQGQLTAYDNGYRYFLDFGTRARLTQLDHSAVAGWNPHRHEHPPSGFPWHSHGPSDGPNRPNPTPPGGVTRARPQARSRLVALRTPAWVVRPRPFVRQRPSTCAGAREDADGRTDADDHAP